MIQQVEATQPSNTGKSMALGRSFDVYYRDKERASRMDRLNAMFVKPGGLAFDIGAHIGDRTGSFLRLGASVVALEPQPRVFRALRLLYGRNPDTTLRCEAVGAERGTLDLFVNSDNPTITTASRALMEAANTSEQWLGQNWDDRIQVPVTTLDHLIGVYGQPDFVKIDVEGFELDVLIGLTRPVNALSFEFTVIQRELALGCLARLSELGPYQFNLSLGEEHRLRYQSWVSAGQLGQAIMALPPEANSGDIFARLSGQQ